MPFTDEVAAAIALPPTTHSAITELVRACHSPAKASGWWNDISTGAPITGDTPRLVAEKLILTVSELSEADEGIDAEQLREVQAGALALLSYTVSGIAARTGLLDIVNRISAAMEGDRKNKMDDHLTHRLMLEVELADAVIRIGDLAGGLGLDLAGAVVEKLAYNAQRADHKLANRQAAGGKKY